MNRTGEDLRPGYPCDPKASSSLPALIRLVPRQVRRAARRIAAIAVECHRAQVRFNELRLAPDRYVFRPDKAPETYGEFLFRTSGPLIREPSADRRHRWHRTRDKGQAGGGG